MLGKNKTLASNSYQFKFFAYFLICIVVLFFYINKARLQYRATRDISSPVVTSTQTLVDEDFQTLLASKCKSISEQVPATKIISISDLPISTSLKVENNFYCVSSWQSAPNISVSFYDSTQSYLLFDQTWEYDTQLLVGDSSTEYKPNAKGILVRKINDIDQYIVLEGSNARFTADKNTWLELYSVKKDGKSALKIMTHTTLISGANKDFAGVLISGYIETYRNTPEEYATLMNKIINELLNPIKPEEKAVMDAQLEKLNAIDFK